MGSRQKILSWEVTWYLQLRKTRRWQLGGGFGEEAEWRQGRVLERFEGDLGETEVPSLGCSCRSLKRGTDFRTMMMVVCVMMDVAGVG